MQIVCVPSCLLRLRDECSLCAKRYSLACLCRVAQSAVFVGVVLGTVLVVLFCLRRVAQSAMLVRVVLALCTTMYYVVLMKVRVDQRLVTKRVLVVTKRVTND
jgi:hypothetical protein